MKLLKANARRFLIVTVLRKTEKKHFRNYPRIKRFEKHVCKQNNNVKKNGKMTRTQCGEITEENNKTIAQERCCDRVSKLENKNRRFSHVCTSRGTDSSRVRGSAAID